MTQPGDALKKLWIVFLCLGLVCSACTPQHPTMSLEATQDSLVKTEMTNQLATLRARPTATPEPTITPTATVTPQPTQTPLPTPTLTPTWAFSPAGPATVPILLYHHIANPEQPNRYYVPPETFDEQMAWLFNNGYTTIPISLLVSAINEGAELPAKPVVITFDDGDLDVYENAYPIMQKYGYSGVFYIISGWIDAKNMVTKAQLGEMIADGWEIGSHSVSHIDLTQNGDQLGYQIIGSKRDLEAALGVPVNTFAYPYGMISPAVADVVIRGGYTAGMGLGTSYEHSLSTIWYLSRREVRSDYDLAAFTSLLPWKDAIGSTP